MRRRPSQRTPTYLLLACLVVVIPYFATNFIYASPLLGRVIAIAVALSTVTTCLIAYGLNPKTIMIKPGAKLDRAQHPKAYTIVTLLLRAMLVCFGFWSLLGLLVPFLRDAYDITQGDLPSVQRSVVTRSTIPLGGLLTLYQEITMSSEPTISEDICQIYAFRLLRVGKTYNLRVLRRSRFVVEATPVD